MNMTTVFYWFICCAFSFCLSFIEYNLHSWYTYNISLFIYRIICFCNIYINCEFGSCSLYFLCIFYLLKSMVRVSIYYYYVCFIDTNKWWISFNDKTFHLAIVCLQSKKIIEINLGSQLANSISSFLHFGNLNLKKKILKTFANYITVCFKKNSVKNHIF